VSITEGTLLDDDKGPSDLAGLEIGIGMTDAEPNEVLNPGRLSELQQAGLVDAIASHLRAIGIHCVAATLVVLDGRATVHGVLGRAQADPNSLAAFWAPRDVCEAAGSIATVQTLAAARAVTRLITIPGGHPLAFHVHAVSIDDAVCVLGRLG
jgi:hypothetical protein